jgi:hypothetical protein
MRLAQKPVTIEQTIAMPIEGARRKTAASLRLQEGWWRLFRHGALADQTFADAEEIDNITHLAAYKLNQRAKP